MSETFHRDKFLIGARGLRYETAQQNKSQATALEVNAHYT